MKFTNATRILKSPGLVFKCFIFLFFGLFINSFIESQQIIFNVGDNIIDYLSRNPTQYLTYGTSVLNIPDGRVDFLKYKAETTEIDTKFLVQGSTVYGVMQYVNNETVLLYDVTGDGILDLHHNLLIIPFWVISESEHTNISGNNNVLQFMDNGLRMFNGNDNPSANGVINTYLTDIASRISASTNNRDLFLGLLEYYIYTDNPALAVMLISELGIRYEARFGTFHPLILLHTAESLINLGENETALIFINDLLSTNPDFIPAKVYSWQLERDPTIKQRKYAELKTNHPNHWIVRQI